MKPKLTIRKNEEEQSLLRRARAKLEGYDSVYFEMLCYTLNPNDKPGLLSIIQHFFDVTYK